MTRCRCEECRRDRKGIGPALPRKTLADRLWSYHAKWMRAREAAFERWVADMLGHAREHRAAEYSPLAIVEVPPGHLMTSGAAAAFGAWAGIDRSVAPTSWLNVKPEPITLEMIREGMRRLLEHRPSPPPVKPWLPRHRADELIADGVSPALIREHFQIF